MWVVTIFNDINDIRMFEYTNREAATAKIEGLDNAILSYTNYQEIPYPAVDKVELLNRASFEVKYQKLKRRKRVQSTFSSFLCQSF